MADTMGESFERTGHPADLRTNAYLSVGTILDAIDQLNPLWDEFTTVSILDGLSIDPVISVERDERVTRVSVQTILRQLTSDRTGAPTVHHSGQIREALHRWVSSLPVSDREAGAHGIRLVGWADSHCTSLALDVVAPRGKTLTSWTPSATLDAAARNLVMVSATVNALIQLDHVSCTRDGAAVVWRHLDQRLSSVIFADPYPCARWQTDPELVCVYTPGFPVVAAPASAARRMAEETMVDHCLLAFLNARELTWKGQL